MPQILDAVTQFPVETVPPQGELVSEQARTGRLYVLKSGALEVVRQGSVIASIEVPGAVIGEMSVLLDVPHSATVRSRAGAEVYVIDDAAKFIDAHPAVAADIARSLADRLHRTSALLVDLRQRDKEHEDRELLDKIFALLK